MFSNLFSQTLQVLGREGIPEAGLEPAHGCPYWILSLPPSLRSTTVPYAKPWFFRGFAFFLSPNVGRSRPAIECLLSVATAIVGRVPLPMATA